jgi:hypothetical protein
MIGFASIIETFRLRSMARSSWTAKSPELIVAVTANLGWTYCAASIAAFNPLGPKRTYFPLMSFSHFALQAIP